MSVYEELDPMVEHRTQLAFKCKREHNARTNTPNRAYPSQDIDIEIPHGSRDHVIVPDTIKIKFNLEIESTDKTSSVVNNVDKALIKKRSSYYNQFHNISRLFDVLPKFSFTTSEMMGDYYL